MNSSQLLIWLLGTLIGSMLFFAAIVAPTVFRALATDTAGVFLRRLFPLYFLWGLLLSILCTAAAFYSANLIAGSICAAVALLFLYARFVLLAQINRARDLKIAGDVIGSKRFRSLHRRSVLINALQLVLLIGLSFLPV
jgi:hypothetical protein